MPKEKRLYTVTKVETVDHGNGCVEQTRRVIGETWAVSPGKAISNITYRKGMRKSGLTEFRGGGCVRWELVAEEVA